jgi:AraC-like DNA-binding protein
MDVLSDVMRAVRLTGAVYFDVNARAPWTAETPALSSICSSVMPEFEHALAFHIMLDGWCWAQLADESEPAVKLEEGDAVLFASGDAHFMSTEQGRRSVPDVALYYRPSDRVLPFVLREFGGEGARARFVCGYFGCDARPFNPLVGALPRMLRVRRSDDGSLVHVLIRAALKETETRRAGGETVLSRLSELIFLDALRQYIDGLDPEATGWFAALHDRYVGTALRLMHAEPAAQWSLDSLAQRVGLSRSAFADRFTSVMGTPPMQYLCSWRLQVAAHMLEAQGLNVAQAAARVGYESEAAFSRAFKKALGVPPAAWRRARAL